MNYKARLDRVVKKIPASYRAGLSFEVVKGPSQTSPGSSLIQISEEDLQPRVHADDFQATFAAGKFDSFTSDRNPYGLKGKEYGEQHAAHVVAHEVGHKVWDRISSEHRAGVERAVAAAKVDTPTTREYAGYVADRKREYESMGMSVPAVLRQKVTRETFSEMFRQHVVEGKHNAFFVKVNKALTGGVVAQDQALARLQRVRQPVQTGVRGGRFVVTATGNRVYVKR